MLLCTNTQELQKHCLSQKKTGHTIAFVPTMGFLHEGHASLMKIARSQADILITSIFVNPLQFGANEDLDVYPRDLERDKKICASENVDILFVPKDFYPPQHSTFVSVENLTQTLCGTSRPTHFQGVTTVVARLFGVTQPDVAVFGEKDYQQLTIIRRMVRDLAMPIQIIGAPLVRDMDGLALSSRNRYLDTKQRQKACSISKTLFAIQKQVENGERDIHQLRKIARESLRVDELDYLEFVDPDTLETVKNISSPTRILIAAWVGKTRLIDNLFIQPPQI